MQKNFLRIFAAATMLLAPSLFASEILTVHGRGRNADYRQATFEALAQAVSQVQGLSLSDARDTVVRSASSSTTADGDISEIRESLQQNVSVSTSGRVRSYTVTLETFDTELKEWIIDVDAQVQGRFVMGRDPNALRRLIVSPFLYEKNSGDGETYCEKIADELNSYLTQTRRFTMLDRKFQNEVNAELGRMKLDNASPDDIDRMSQQLISDYMVSGSVKTYPPPAARYNKYTGSTTTADSVAVEISYSVILVPTAQLKWQHKVSVLYSQCGTLNGAWAIAAREISAEIIDNIYPIRITAHTPVELVLNQGGNAVTVGDIYEVSVAGEPIVDVTNGETLPGPETMIARIRVTRSDPKMSYAVVVDGTDFQNIPVGAFVRRPKQVMPGYQPHRQSSTIVHPNGGVVPPWMVR